MAGRHQDLPTGLEQVTALTKKSHEETGRENVVKGKELLASQGQLKDKVDRGRLGKTSVWMERSLATDQRANEMAESI